MENYGKKLFPFLLSLLLIASFVHAQITVNSPLTRNDIKSCSDYADETLLDRWDMNTRTDLGWRIFNTVEQPLSYLTNITFQNGIFSATTSGTDPNVTFLDSAYPGTAMLGKIGANFPIDANKYTRLIIRMSVQIDQPLYWGQILWSKNTIFGGITTSNAFLVHPGWYIYMIDIPSLGVAVGTDPWNGQIDSLRLDPTVENNKLIQIDWIRLVEYDVNNTRQISWSGNSGNVDVYLDNDSNPGNGTLGMLKENVSDSSFSFLAGGLAPGDYYVVVVAAGSNPSSGAYSSGYYHVNDAPIIRLTQPSSEGSDTDFITVSCADPWDMENSEDVEYTENLVNASFTTLSYENQAGSAYSNRTVYYAQNQNGSDDPNVFFLHFLWRGNYYWIDTNKYHNLTFKMGIWGTQSVNDGSIARVMWRNKDETGENVSQDIIIRHLPNTWIMNKIVCDMNNMPLDVGPENSGWNGELDSFRIDPHEFSSQRAFFFDEIKLTSDCQANNFFTIEWNLSDSDHSPTVSIYYDANNSGYDGILIVSGLTPGSGSGSYVWDTSGVSEGKYWIYTVIDDGVNINRSYSTGPVVIDHALIPEISLSEDTLYFGAERNGPSTSPEDIILTNTGQGSLNWQAVATKSWIDVNPSSGTGNGVISISVDHSGLGTGSYNGQVRIDDQKAWNSPQFIDITLTVYGQGGDSAPFGTFDTPVEGSTVSGNIPVTGWALDDIEVTKIEIKRGPHPDDVPAIIGPDGLVYIGDAIFVKGARPDVYGVYPTNPRADCAGWGYMMLTNFLPNSGNGDFTICVFAYDGTGHKVQLGQKIITCDNANRVKPFGTIDTPAQGGMTSGAAYANFGWALTPPPKLIPTDGSTIWVYIDGVPKANAAYNLYRDDIASLFPGYLNSDGAVGLYYIDTTQYSNGVHNIAWSVTDDDGATDGIGSRYFEVQNLGGANTIARGGGRIPFQEDTSGRLQIKVKLIDIGKRPDRFRAYDQDQMQDESESGFWHTAYNAEPLRIEIEELERIVLRLERNSWGKLIGWGRETSRSLPIGSTLDDEKGLFYWMPGPGFLGRHVLHFAVSDDTCRGMPVRVIVDIRPKTFKVEEKPE